MVSRHRKLWTSFKQDKVTCPVISHPLRAPRAIMMSAVCAVLIAVLAACGGGSPTDSGSTSGTAAGGNGSLSGGTDISGKSILFEIQSTPSDSFFVPVVNGAKAAAAIAGVKLQVQYASGDDTTEINQINTAIASGVAGVAVSIPDAGLNNVVCSARSKNIAVVAFNIDGATGQGASCVQGFVGQDFVQSGALIAQRMINAGQIKAGDHVFCPVESPNQVYAVERYAGVKQALSAIGATCEELGTGNDYGPAKATMVSYLLGHRNTAAIIGLGHTPLDQAPAAIKQVGMNIPIGGFDVTSDILSAIKSGTITATVDQSHTSRDISPSQSLLFT